MSKGVSGLFNGTSGTKANQTIKLNKKPINGVAYNRAGSNSLGAVDIVTTTKDLHSIPSHSTPNSVSKNYKNGHLDSERYYDKDGNAYLDIDYTNHGNCKTHPHVPHEHSIYFDKDGKMHREDEPEGGLNK